MRRAEICRKTAETDISLMLNLDGEGRYDIDTGSGFLNHMLELFAKHGRFDLMLRCQGDTYVDDHHTVEDVGICLGQALKKALGDKKGIARYGFFILPMDEALILTAVDFSGRAQLEYELALPAAKVGSFDTELVEEFMAALAREGAMNLHIQKLNGRNTHHIIEGTFKSLARSVAMAAAIDPARQDELPSTKGML